VIGFRGFKNKPDFYWEYFGKIDAPQIGSLRDRRIQLINGLTLEQLDDLGEALLDFGELADLDNWLTSRIGE
jgi:hypothetical protein